MNLKQKLSEFLGFSLSQQEMSLCIVSKNEIKEYEEFFASEGFKVSNNVLDFLASFGKDKNSVLVAHDKNLKEIYDIASQYPTGQISFFDKLSMKTNWINPSYDHSRAIVIIDKDQLKNNSENIPLLSVFGLTYQ